MTTFLLVASESGGGAWPPVAALCLELVNEGHSVSVLCDESIKDAFTGADILLIPDEVHSSSFIHNLFNTEIVPRLQAGEPVESISNPLETWADAAAPLVIPEVKAKQPDIVVGSMFELPLAINLARQLDIPVVAINPGLISDRTLLVRRNMIFWP